MTDAELEILQRAGWLMGHEARLRHDARQLELYPSLAKEARRLFRRASAARRLRMTLLRRCRVL